MQKTSKSKGDDLLKKSISYALNSMNQKQSYAFIKRILKEKTYTELKAGKKTLSNIDFKDLALDEGFERKISSFDLKPIFDENRAFLESSSSFKSSDHEGIIANGWTLGPFDETETFLDSDFSLLENFMLKIGLKQIKELISKWKLNGNPNFKK